MDNPSEEQQVIRLESPFHWVNAQGLQLRLQVFVKVKDAEGRIALVQLKENPGFWWLPAETLQPNEPVKEAAKRVCKTWFGDELDPRVSDVVTFPYAEGDPAVKWYIVHVFEADAPEGGLELLDDTKEITFVEPGSEPPGPFAMGHEDMWPLME